MITARLFRWALGRWFPEMAACEEAEPEPWAEPGASLGYFDPWP